MDVTYPYFKPRRWNFGGDRLAPSSVALLPLAGTSQMFRGRGRHRADDQGLSGQGVGSGGWLWLVHGGLW